MQDIQYVAPIVNGATKDAYLETGQVGYNGDKRVLCVGTGEVQPSDMLSEHGEQVVKNKTIDLQENTIKHLYPPGTLLIMLGNAKPPGKGWLELKEAAQELNRTEYPDLFSVIGTSCGSGDGVNTFNIPPRGVVLVGGAVKLWLKAEE